MIFISGGAVGLFEPLSTYVMAFALRSWLVRLLLRLYIIEILTARCNCPIRVWQTSCYRQTHERSSVSKGKSPFTVFRYRNITFYVKVEWALQLTYFFFWLPLLNIHPALLPSHIFISNNDSGSIAWVATFFMSIGLGMSSLFGVIIRCKPISFLWDRDQAGSCVNLTGLLISAAAVK